MDRAQGLRQKTSAMYEYKLVMVPGLLIKSRCILNHKNLQRSKEKNNLKDPEGNKKIDEDEKCIIRRSGC